MRNFSEYAGPMVSWPMVEVIPGAIETLEKLRADWLLALATNAADSNELEIWAALQRAGANQVLDRIYCFGNVGYKKPAAGFYEYILNDLNMVRAQVVMVGDDYETDVLGANRCGIRAIWFNQHSQENCEGILHTTIHEYGELTQALVRLGQS